MDMKAEILDYINCNETTGALLLTGPWGCGKSYLMKQVAKELNEEKSAAVAVISLFGLESISAINKRVKDEYTNFDLGTVGKAIKKVSTGMATLAKDGLAVAGTAAPGTVGLSAASQGIAAVMSYDVFNFIEVKNTVGKDEKERKFVVVFDDLERCGITNKQDLLGAINEFVENKQIKVIIIADEEKIGAEEYKEYKEKLISRTIRMTADNNFLIDSIVINYNENEAIKGYKAFLIENRDLLKQVFFESKTSNIRTFKCILADFERIYAAWKETDVPTDNMKWVLYTFGAEVFISKSPKKEECPPQKKEYAEFMGENEKQYANKGKNNSSLLSTSNWINHGIWDRSRFVAELTQRYAHKNETPLYRFLMYNVWVLQQKDIDEGLRDAVAIAYDGGLSKDDLIELIGKIHFLRQYKISLPVEVDYSKIEEGFEKRFRGIVSGMIDEPRSHRFIGKSGVDEAAYNLLNKIERFDDRLLAAENRSKYLGYLSGENSDSTYSFQGMYIEEFDEKWLNLFIAKYDVANNYEKRAMARSLLDMVYDFDTYSTEDNIERTKTNFNVLATHIEAIKTDDSIAEIINKSFVEEIRKKYVS